MGTAGRSLLANIYRCDYDGGRTISATTSAGGGATTIQTIAHDVWDRLTSSSDGANTGS